jgi:autotransporter-associated beta strand protein
MIQTTSTVASAETINAPLVLEGSYTFTSAATSASAILTLGGGITPGPTTGTTTLTLNGTNTGLNNVKGVLADHGAGRLAVSKSGAGTWILSGADSYTGGTTVSAGTLEFDTAPTLANSTTFAVSGGTLRFKVSAGGTVGTGVTATVASGATLELAGSVSALASGANRANITNSSTTPAGVLVSGTNQIVGNIDGAGNTQVNAGSSLTANHIIQNALSIGGTAASHGTVTIAASNASGNPLIDVSDVSLSGAGATSLIPPASLPPEPLLAGDLSASFDSIADSSNLSLGGTSRLGGNLSAVPEPSGMLLLAVGGFAILSRVSRRARSKFAKLG